MASKNKKNDIDRSGIPKSKIQVSTVVGDCRIKLNFDPKPSSGIINDVKKMILSGLSKM